jgi:mycofactocin system creatininase family protein
MPDMNVAHSASSDIEHDTTIVILPLGAWEQHGPHLPLATDTLIIDAVIAEAINAGFPMSDKFLLAPTLSITASDEHQGFPGTLSSGTQALTDSVVAICRSASWARSICIVNGHGGNADALRKIAAALDHEKISYSIWSLPSYGGSDMHAGHTETSLMLHLNPSLVKAALLESGATGNPTDLIDAMRAGGVSAVAPNGIIGDATTATSAHGKEVLDLYVGSLRSHLSGLVRQ